MQPTYLYSSDFDREVRWRSRFSMGPPILIGFIQMILTFAIIGLEIASVIISPIYGTLYAGFWLSVIFTLSWISMFGLVCCHRARKWATYLLLISILCAAAAIALIVLNAFFIGDITRCFFSSVTCTELSSSFPQLISQPLGRKVQILKAQIACAALMLATALLYILLYIFASRAARSSFGRNVLIEQHQLPPQLARQAGRYTPPPPPPQPPPPQQWKSTRVPVTYDPSQMECPHCGTLIKLTQGRRYT